MATSFGLGQVGAMEPLGYFDPAGFCKVGDKVRDPGECGVLRVLDIRIAAMVQPWSGDA